MSDTLGDALPREQARCRELLTEYRKLGPVGAFGARFIEESLKEADAAVMSGDLARMIAAYQRLKEHE